MDSERIECPLCDACLKPGSLWNHLRDKEGLRAEEIRRRWPGMHRVIRDARIAADPRRHTLDAAITCCVCGMRLHNLGNHLPTHGIDAQTYRGMYPGSPITSAHFNAVKADLFMDRFGPTYWTRERIVIALKRCAKSGRTPTVNSWRRGTRSRSRPTSSHVIRVFGSWSAALWAADIEPLPRGGRTLTACKRGHSLTDETNVLISPSGKRVCRACRRIRERKTWARAA